MGCFKGIIRIIILVALVAGFFYFQGPKFVKEKYDEYTSPPREVLIQEEMNFGNLSYVPLEYTLQRSLSLGKYKKITATHRPTGQKINIIDLGDAETVNQSDFYSKKIDLKLYQILDNIKSCPVGFSDIEVTQRGTIPAKGKVLPYVNFKAKVKNVPFVTISGTISAFNTVNKNDGIISKIEKAVDRGKDKETTKVILSAKITSKYSFETAKNFIQTLSFTGIK